MSCSFLCWLCWVARFEGDYPALAFDSVMENFDLKERRK
jgi:hypothetical protein